MSANKLIKEWGLVAAKSIMSSNEDSEEFKVYLNGDHWKNPSVVIVKDLKRTVESHRLIEVEGGIDQVKDTFSFAYKHGAKELTEHGKIIKQAIFDVESCQ